MKKNILLVVVTVCSIVSAFAQGMIKIDTSKSVVNWSASYSFEFGGHEGTVQFKEGTLFKMNDKIVGGTFVIDMNTIANTDGDYNQGLVDHLKNEDFFDVPKHPTAQLEITSVKYHDPKNTPNSDKTFLRMNADLTIKGITLPIMYESEINAENTQMISRFKIDRTKWDVNFGAKGVSSKMKNRLISDAISFEVTLNK
jgi:polyisoprenoid-binding protein YceI